MVVRLVASRDPFVAEDVSERIEQPHQHRLQIRLPLLAQQLVPLPVTK